MRTTEAPLSWMVDSSVFFSLLLLVGYGRADHTDQNEHGIPSHDGVRVDSLALLALMVEVLFLLQVSSVSSPQHLRAGGEG